MKYWVSAERATVFADVEGDIIVAASPLVKKFVGQSFSSLKKWVSEKFGGGLVFQALSSPPVEGCADKTPETNVE